MGYEMTVDDIKAFQAAHPPLDVDGDIGPETKAAMQADPNWVAPPPAPAVPVTGLVYPVKSFDIFAGSQTDAQLDALYGDGYRAVIDYYSWSETKNLTRASALRHGRHGMLTGVVWEADGATVAGFSGEQGIRAAKEAVELATAVGQPKGSGIAFAVDFGPSSSFERGQISAYFGGAATIVRTAGFQNGCYGCGDVMTMLFHMGLIDYDWLAGAMGWPGSRNYVSPFPGQNGRPAMTQGLEDTEHGMDIDRDMVYREGILFQVGA